jgi:hypothetical protein
MSTRTRRSTSQGLGIYILGCFGPHHGKGGCAIRTRDAINAVLQLRSDCDVDAVILMLCSAKIGSTDNCIAISTAPRHLEPHFINPIFTPSTITIHISSTVKKGLSSLRYSTSSLSLRPPPSETESNDAARQWMQISRHGLQVEYEAEVG